MNKSELQTDLAVLDGLCGFFEGTGKIYEAYYYHKRIVPISKHGITAQSLTAFSEALKAVGNALNQRLIAK